MANQRSTFSKRNREMKLKDRARDKAERRAARAADKTETKGPPIAWDTPGGIEGAANAANADADAATTTPPATDDDDT